jgi:hypothetical protein
MYAASFGRINKSAHNHMLAGTIKNRHAEHMLGAADLLGRGAPPNNQLRDAFIEQSQAFKGPFVGFLRFGVGNFWRADFGECICHSVSPYGIKKPPLGGLVVRFEMLTCQTSTTTRQVGRLKKE